MTTTCIHECLEQQLRNHLNLNINFNGVQMHTNWWQTLNLHLNELINREKKQNQKTFYNVFVIKTFELKVFIQLKNV